MLRGTLTEDQIARIVGLCELAGKIDGVKIYTQLGDLLAALEKFERVEPE